MELDTLHGMNPQPHTQNMQGGRMQGKILTHCHRKIRLFYTDKFHQTTRQSQIKTP